jgi:hypothetical protein
MAQWSSGTYAMCDGVVEAVDEAEVERALLEKHACETGAEDNEDAAHETAIVHCDPKQDGDELEVEGAVEKVTRGGKEAYGFC